MEDNINVYDKKERKIISPKTYITKEKNFLKMLENMKHIHTSEERFKI